MIGSRQSCKSKHIQKKKECERKHRTGAKNKDETEQGIVIIHKETYIIPSGRAAGSQIELACASQLDLHLTRLFVRSNLDIWK